MFLIVCFRLTLSTYFYLFHCPPYCITLYKPLCFILFWCSSFSRKWGPLYYPLRWLYLSPFFVLLIWFLFILFLFLLCQLFWVLAMCKSVLLVTYDVFHIFRFFHLFLLFHLFIFTFCYIILFGLGHITVLLQYLRIMN